MVTIRRTPLLPAPLTRAKIERIIMANDDLYEDYEDEDPEAYYETQCFHCGGFYDSDGVFFSKYPELEHYHEDDYPKDAKRVCPYCGLPEDL